MSPQDAAIDWHDLFGPPACHREIGRGDFLFLRGTPVEAVFALERGRLRLERTLESGSLVTLALLRAGEGVAEAALFSDTYHCDARAEVASRVAVFPRQAALEHLSREPASMAALLRVQASQIRRLRALLEVRSIRRADERLLAYLDLREALGESSAPDRPATAVARELGLTAEAFYRALTRLEAEGRIQREKGGLRRRP